jgi:serine/threonine protein phosphatase 1
MNMARTFVLGDIHGAYKALIQCFNKSGFDYDLDQLIFLGDICDGWSQVDLCFEELLKVKNLVYILGNHDEWLINWAKTGKRHIDWIMNGGLTTIHAYPNGVNDQHLELLEKAKLYHLENNRLFVHAGINPDIEITKQDKEIFIWDRKLQERVIHYKKNMRNEHISRFDEIYIGHTPTINYDSLEPIQGSGVIMMDTGAGWDGVLTIMNIDTKEFFSSDLVTELYPFEKGRR